MGNHGQGRRAEEAGEVAALRVAPPRMGEVGSEIRPSEVADEVTAGRHVPSESAAEVVAKAASVKARKGSLEGIMQMVVG